MTSSKSFNSKKNTYLYSGIGVHKTLAYVIIPNVPSDPINNYFISVPVLSFLFLFNKFKIFPFGNTTSNPKM